MGSVGTGGRPVARMLRATNEGKRRVSGGWASVVNVGQGSGISPIQRPNYEPRCWRMLEGRLGPVGPPPGGRPPCTTSRPELWPHGRPPRCTERRDERADVAVGHRAGGAGARWHRDAARVRRRRDRPGLRDARSQRRHLRPARRCCCASRRSSRRRCRGPAGDRGSRSATRLVEGALSNRPRPFGLETRGTLSKSHTLLRRLAKQPRKPRGKQA
jgi:hypothetical protein